MSVEGKGRMGNRVGKLPQGYRTDKALPLHEAAHERKSTLGDTARPHYPHSGDL